MRRALAGSGVGVLALAFALGCSSGKQPPVAARNPLADSADQVLFKTKTVLTDGGVMKAEVYSDTAYVFDDNTRVEMRGLRTVFFTALGARNAVLTSHQGTYNTRTNNMDARGDVVVVTVDGRRLTTPFLRYMQGRNEISSDTAFTASDSTHHMAGVGFVSDPDMNNVRCLRACSGSAGTVRLPGGTGDTTRGPSVSPPSAGGARPLPSSGQSVPPSAGGGAATKPGGSAHAAATGRATGTVPSSAKGATPGATAETKVPAAAPPAHPTP